MTQTITLYLAKSKSQKWFLNESKKISDKLDKFVTYCQGYNKIKSRILPKSLLTLHRPKSLENFFEDQRKSRFDRLSAIRSSYHEKTKKLNSKYSSSDSKTVNNTTVKGTSNGNENEPLLSSSSSSSNGRSASFVLRETKTSSLCRRRYNNQQKYGVPMIPEVLLSYSYTRGNKSGI